MDKESLCDLHRVLADTRVYLSQPLRIRQRRCTDQVDAGAGSRTDLRIHAGEFPEWHPFAVWRRHVLTQR